MLIVFYIQYFNIITLYYFIIRANVILLLIIHYSSFEIKYNKLLSAAVIFFYVRRDFLLNTIFISIILRLGRT